MTQKTEKADYFQDALMQTLDFEGGIRKTPTEYSNRGVRQDYYSLWAKANGMEDKDVKDLKLKDVEGYYKSEYWDRPKINSITNKNVSELLFDFGVNAGPGTAIKKMQEIIGAKPDGIIGPKTRKALDDYIEKNGEKVFTQNFLNSRANHYQELYVANPEKHAGDIQGWINRVTTLSKKYQ